MRARLRNCRRCFASRYARRDQGGGDPPLALFVFQDAADCMERAPFAGSDLETIAQRGNLADTWLPPAPETWE